MTEYGRRGIDLVKEIFNHDHTSVSAYNEELVRLVLSEVGEHQHQATRIIRDQQDQAEQASENDALGTHDWEANPAAAVSLVVHLESIARNKRLLLGYMLQRMDRLKSVRWDQRVLPQQILDMISPQEHEFYRSYDRILTKYMSRANGIGLDLTLDTKPPKDISVQVKVLRSMGETIFSFGRITLSRGLLVFLPVDEAEPLIKAGVLEVVDRKEFF